MKVLVAGHKGWIGGYVFEASLKLFSEVRGFDLKTGQDLCEYNHIWSALEDIDIVYNCAGEIREAKSVEDPKRYWRNNTLAAVTLFQAALARHCRVIHISTVAAKDTIAFNSNLTPYGQSKFAAEIAALQFSDQGLDIQCARLHNPYGPGQPEDFAVPTFFKKALKGEEIKVGRNGRDYVYVEDIAKYLTRNGLDNRNDFYELGTGEMWTDEGLALKVLETVQRRCSITVNQEANPSIRVAFQPPRYPWTKLEEGLRRTLAAWS